MNWNKEQNIGKQLLYANLIGKQFLSLYRNNEVFKRHRLILSWLTYGQAPNGILSQESKVPKT